MQMRDAGSYAVVIRNELGPVTSTAAAVAVGSAPIISTPTIIAPTISAQPSAQSVLGGQSLTLAITVTGAPAPTLQWRKDGEPIAGATGTTFSVPSAQAGDAGAYTVVVTNTAGTVTSTAATVAVNTSRIVNLSIRSALTPGAALLTVGFVVSGSGKNLLARGVGPTLAQFGLTNALADPRIALFAGSSALANNDNWSTAANAAQVSSTAAQIGAFALGAGSNDAAVLTSFDDGTYSAQISGPANASGIVLVELYDANPASASRLVNVSTRAQVGRGENILVAGFVVSGNAPKTLLIRAIGPTLAAFGVTDVLADPRLEIIGSTATGTVAANDNWGGSTALSSAFAARGAFPLAAADSKDAALLVTLQPGNYSAQVSGVGDTTGEALIEIYEVP
ncbi:MAG: hypothetical protein EXS37_16525 [Opitutus sp.]|nr:hypothetical protein [Opitutus sp.]